jgi:4-hydroxymandelate oxidase
VLLSIEDYRTAFEQIALRPRVLVDATERSLATEVLGTPTPVPFLLGPTSAPEYMDLEGELAVGDHTIEPLPGFAGRRPQ